MPFPARQIHVICTFRGIETTELNSQSLCMLRLNTRIGSFAEKPLKSLVAESPNHVEVYRYEIQPSRNFTHPLDFLVVPCSRRGGAAVRVSPAGTVRANVRSRALVERV